MNGKTGGMIILVFFLGAIGASLLAYFLFFSINHATKEEFAVGLYKGGAAALGLVGEKKKDPQVEIVEEFMPWSENQVETEPISTQEEESFSFSVIGDSERYKGENGYKESVLETWNKVGKMRDDLIFFTGDILIADGGSQDENRRRIEHVKGRFDQLFPKSNYHIAFGNHDVQCGTPCVDLWQEIFFGKKYEEDEERILYRSFDYSNTHFVLLSSSYPARKAVDAKQLSWLDEDLSNSKKDNLIVFIHVPPVTFFKESAKGCHDMSCSEPNRSQLMQTLKKHSVDLVVSGHEDVFDHKIESGIDFVLSGNADGGEPNYEGVMNGQNFTNFQVDGDNILMKTVDVHEGVVREIEIK